MGRASRPASRRDVLPTLTAFVRDATAGRPPATVVLTAASGAGKTRVLGDLAERLTVPTRRVAADSGSLHEPYGVVRRLLDVPLPEPVPQDSAERLLARLDALASAGPLVLVIDDVHRADAASLSVLEGVAAAAADLRLALLLTRQPTPERAFLTRILDRGDCLELELPGLDALDLDALVHEHTGHWPGPRLRGVLGGAPPLQALTLLDDLRPSLTETGDLLEVPAHDDVPVAAAAVTDRVGRLEGRPREVARALAVLGTAPSLDDVAALLASEPVTLVEPLQSLIDGGVATFDAEGRVTFTHDAWRDAVYAGITAPLRSVLHAAAAAHVSPAQQPGHLVSSGAPAAQVMAGVSLATGSLGHAPAVEADLLDQVAGAVQPDLDAAAELAARRARALARSGQFRRAEEIAQAALPDVRDPAVYSELMRVTIFSRSTRADVPGVLAALDETLRLPVPDRTRRVLTEHRAYMSLLGGTGPVPEEPIGPDPASLALNGLVAEALRNYLLGQLPAAVEYAWEASRRVGAPDVDPNEGASADVWPPVFELAQHGPQAAREALREVVRLREQRGAGWQTASHQSVAGAIDLAAGRLADAAANLDSALEVGAGTDFGWTSQPVGARALVDVLRGDLVAAEDRLDAWEAESLPLQLGLPQPERARVALLEAQRRYAAAAELALLIWRRAASMRLRSWMVNVAPELCRVAIRAADPLLLDEIGQGLADVPRPWSPAWTPYLQLAEAHLGEPTALAEAAAAVAARASALGETYVELMAREEAAVATALLGDRPRARELAAGALQVAADCGAEGTAVRIAGRLRAAGVRLGSTAPRSRPTSGWASLTPTEQLVVDQVAAGRTGPEIGQRLNISPRTVQTHVSHVLTKLGLSHRVELAAAAASR